MNCRDAREIIYSYIDNNLDPERDAHLMEHVKGCDKCRRELALLLEYKDTVKKIKPVKAPDNFMYELHRRIEAESEGTLKRVLNRTVSAWRHFRFPFEAAGVLAVALLIFFLYTPVFHREKAVETISEERLPVQGQKIEEHDTSEPGLGRDEKKKSKNETRPLSIEKKIPSVNEITDKDLADKEITAERTSDEDKQESAYEGEKSAAGAYSSDSSKPVTEFRKNEKSKSRLDFSKKADMPSLARTPESIFSEYGATVKTREVNGDGRILYLVEIRESVIKTLTQRLEKDYTVSSRITGKNDGFCTLEFIIKKKPE